MSTKVPWPSRQSKGPDNGAVAQLLDEIGTILDLKGENPFKSRAYHAAARTVASLDRPVAELVASGELAELPGIGEVLTAKITELVTTGRLKYYEEIRSDIPDGLFEMLRIPDLGPKRVRVLWEKLGIDGVSKLEYAARCGRLQTISGFGPRLQGNVLKGIAMLKRMQGLYLLVDAVTAASEIIDAMKRSGSVKRISIAGSARRMKETVHDLDVVASGDSDAIMDAAVSVGRVESVAARGETKCSVILDDGMAVDIRVVPDESYPFALQHFTGSKEHNVALRGIAKNDFGCKLNEYGLFRGSRRIRCRSEEEIYAALGLAYVPPEMREDAGELDLARSGRLPVLVSEGDIKGIVHVHTNWSDGLNSIEEMARAAQELGYKYIAVTDHTASSTVANGLCERRIREQWKEIDAVNGSLRGIRVLKGAEVDIRPDGTLDYGEKVLRHLEVVIAALHSGFKADGAAITARVSAALANPYVHIFAHPTGRLLLGREPYAIDVEAVIRAAAAHRKVMELNANPHRLDLDWRHLKLCRECGVRVSINSDAHQVAGLGEMKWGVGTARRGWLTPADVVNTLDADAFLAAIRS